MKSSQRYIKSIVSKPLHYTVFRLKLLHNLDYIKPKSSEKLKERHDKKKHSSTGAFASHTEATENYLGGL